MHLDVRVVGVGLAREHGLELAALDLLAELRERGLGLGDHRRVLFGLAERDQFLLVGEFLRDAAQAFQLVAERGALLHQPGAALGIVPELGVLGEPVEFA